MSDLAIQKIDNLINDIQSELDEVHALLDMLKCEVPMLAKQDNNEYMVLKGFEMLEVNKDGDFRWARSKNKYHLHPTFDGRYTIKYRPFRNAPLKHKSPYLMIASLFVANPNNYRIVKSIDGDLRNLKASNLKWVYSGVKENR